MPSSPLSGDCGAYDSTRQAWRTQTHDYLELWNSTGERVHHALYVAVHEQVGREASPTAAIIDSQSAKGAQKGRLVGAPRGLHM
jgi:hypothetical protein